MFPVHRRPAPRCCAARVSGGVYAADVVLAVDVYQNRDRLVALGQGVEVPPDTTSEKPYSVFKLLLTPRGRVMTLTLA